MPVQANSKVKPKSSSKTLIGWGNFDSVAGMKLLVLSKKFFTNKVGFILKIHIAKGSF